MSYKGGWGHHYEQHRPYYKMDVVDELEDVKRELRELKKSVRTSEKTEEYTVKEQIDEK